MNIQEVVNRTLKLLIYVIILLLSSTWYATSYIPLTSAEIAIEEKKVELLPELKAICGCESVGNPKAEPQQFHKDGSVIRGVVNNQDVGMCQINLYYHEKAADKLGLDLFTEQGNIIYANHLYTEQGSTPWKWSKGCWGNYTN